VLLRAGVRVEAAELDLKDADIDDVSAVGDVRAIRLDRFLRRSGRRREQPTPTRGWRPGPAQTG
jgi:hypothetical protein